MTGNVGLLLVGALGYVASCVIAGVACLKRGVCDDAGLVTELDEFASLDLLDPGRLVLGGWDIRSGSTREAVAALSANSLPAAQAAAVLEGLPEMEILPGTSLNCGKTVEGLATPDGVVDSPFLEEIAARLRNDIRRFKLKHGLTTVVVVNLASTEPPGGDQPATVEQFQSYLSGNRSGQIRASTLYAWAAVNEHCPFINFTPSEAALAPAVVELAERLKVPVMGSDGKTGETLVKSALAPLFRYRNLEVLSWESFNILGNMDGKVLDDPGNKESKLRTKKGVLGRILDYEPHSSVHIHHVPSLDDQKTAWNFIHFRGFLGVRMTLQFTWQGYDSFLAAPLVLDLVRLAELALRRGEGGLQPHLASFFKHPLGVNEHRLSEQFKMLAAYAEGMRAGA